MVDVSSKNDRFSILGRIGIALMSEMDRGRLLKIIARAACELTGAQLAAFTLRKLDAYGQPTGPSRGNLFRLAAVVGVTPEQEDWFRKTGLGGRGLLAPIFQRGESVLIADILHYDPAAHHHQAFFYHGNSSERSLPPTSIGLPAHHPQLRSFLATPLLNRNREVVGGLLLGHTEPDSFTVEDEALLVGLASQATIALENVRLRHLTSTQNIQERMLTESQVRRAALRIVVDELPSSVFLVHGYDAKIILANRSATSVWGADWHYQQPLEDFLKSNGIRIFDARGVIMPFDQLAIIRAARYGESVYSHEEVIRHTDGTDLPVLVNASVLDLNNLLNITAREIMDIGDDQRVALVVNQDVSILKEAEHAKDEFIGIAAHELRTPLAVLRGFVQTLDTHSVRGHGTRLADWQIEALHGIDQSTVRMAELIDDLLDVSRLQAGNMDLMIEPFDLLALVRRCMKRMQTVTSKHQLILHTDEEYMVVMIDTRHMEQVIDNLLGNATKYSPNGGPIEMNVCYWREQGKDDMALFSIHDHGIGIPAQQQASIFQRFQRADNAREFGGTGLGLYVSRALVECQNGHIWFDSVEGQGSTFYVTLPLYHEGDEVGTLQA
jgi:Signal transduction histidine kinase